MSRYGLIGKALTHSLSQQYFEEKFAAAHRDDCSYALYAAGEAVSAPVELSGWLHRLVEEKHLAGFNVTVPFKQWVLPCLDRLSPEAAEIGAANCVQVQWRADGSYMLTGHNTDAPAFRATLQPLLQPWHTHALVLGTGGAAHAVAYALRHMGIGCTMVSRHPDTILRASTSAMPSPPAGLTESDAHRQQVPAAEPSNSKDPDSRSSLTKLSDSNDADSRSSLTKPSDSKDAGRQVPAEENEAGDCPYPAVVSYEEAMQLSGSIFLIVNATPVGMFPNEAAMPWPDVHRLSFRHLCYDLIYNPEETRFLIESELAGAAVQNGYAMLTTQADLSWQLWQQ